MGPFIANNPTVTSGVFDLTAFLFIDSSSLKPQPAKFNDQTKFDRFVRTIGAWCQFEQNTCTNICLRRKYKENKRQVSSNVWSAG